MIFGIVYRISCETSGKAYVGQTTRTLGHRFEQHMKCTAKKRYALGAAVHKYGRTAFRIEVLERCLSRAELDASEQRWIAHSGTLSPHGYNLASGGRAFNHNPLSKAKIGNAHKGRRPHANTCASVRVANAQRVVSAETKARMSASGLRAWARRKAAANVA